MSAPKPHNLDPSPMEFETHVMPNPNNERSRLAREADSLSRADLVERASELGVPTGGTKGEIAERARQAARTD